MFRRFTDRLTNAVLGETSGVEDKVRTLQSMGFEATQARGALEATNGDIDRAAELMLSGAPSHRPTTTAARHTAPTTNQGQTMRNAMEESRQSEEQRMYRMAQEASLQAPQQNLPRQTAARAKNTKKPSPPPPARAAAINKADQAAKNRATNRTKNNHSPIQQHHPNVKVPTKLEDKSKEEQVLRNVDRVKGHPAAVDTLYKALTALRDNPDNSKFRKIDQTHPGYQRSLANAPGAEALFLTMNFTQLGPNTLVLDRSRVDLALLYLGVSALEGAKDSVEYREAKRQIQFEKELNAISLLVNTSEKEAVLRANYISKCPTEPAVGRGALVQVGFGKENTKRRFDGDDVLQDVINWLGGHGSTIPEKLLSREWCLVDKNRYPVSPIDCKLNLDKTLQYVGFWPSGKVEMRPSPVSWVDGSDQHNLLGSTRGLGAAPNDTLR